MDRRATLSLGISALTLLASGALAENMDEDGRIATDSTEIVPLWTGVPPGGEKVAAKTTVREASPTPDQFHNRVVVSVATPLLTVYRAVAPNGSALLLIPGGGYGIELIDREGIETARLFNRAGITCFILRYRLPEQGWADGADTPLQDAQRAMRLIRANAATFGVNPAKIGVIGFSAGGHLAASLATRFNAKVYTPRDSADSQDAKPSIVALLFPVITMGDGTDSGTRTNLLGKMPAPEAILAYSCDKHVPADAPPSFICLAADDPIASPTANGIAMYHALRAVGVASELHVFEQGGHGFGVWNAAGKSFAAWPQLFLQWGASHGFITMTPPEAAHFAL